MEGAGQFIILPTGASWFGNIAGRGGGYRSGQGGEFISSMDSIFNRSVVFGRI